jgi:hypothetical protein
VARATGHCKQPRMSRARWLESSVGTELVLDGHTRCFRSPRATILLCSGAHDVMWLCVGAKHFASGVMTQLLVHSEV